MYGAKTDVRFLLQADTLARDAQAQGEFAVSQPPWVAHLCMPHWKVVHTLLSSNLTLASPTAACSGPPLEQLTANLSRLLEIYSEYFCSSGAGADGDSDTLCSASVSTSHKNSATSPSPLGGASIRQAASEAIPPGAVVSPPRGPLAASSTACTTSSSTTQGNASMCQSGGSAEAPLNVYMPPDHLSTSNLRVTSPLRQASAAAAASTADAAADAPAKKHVQGLPEALCLNVACACTSPWAADKSSNGGATRLGAGSCSGRPAAAGSGCAGADCSSADAFMSVFEFKDAPHGQTHGVSLSRPQERELRHMFARMYEVVDCGAGDETVDTADSADSVSSPAAVMYLYPKIVGNLPIPKPAQNAQQVHPVLGAGHTSPTSTAITSPTPQSSLPLTYCSGSLSVSLPATEAAAVQVLIPKPSVETFGLEPDGSTSISLGATPIPCMLAVCYGPEGASSSASASPTASTTARCTEAVGVQAAEQGPFAASDDRNVSAAAHVAGSEAECSADDAHEVLSHASLPESAGGAAPALSLIHI